jgi:hypothetical protein
MSLPVKAWVAGSKWGVKTEPTATQLRAAHETPARAVPAGSGVGSIVQLVPFQTSTSA